MTPVQTLTLGFSPCPNDTFMFYPLIKGRLPTAPFRFREQLEDIDTLNGRALRGELDVCKVSCHAYGHIRDQYVLLRAGSAMGQGCGPLVIARSGLSIQRLRRSRIAIPGHLTTATLLLRLHDPTLTNLVVLPYYDIIPAIAEGRVDAGVIIHESRFTFPRYGLQVVVDLGDWWEQETNLPLPLGGIAARRSLGTETLTSLSDILRASIRYSSAHTAETSAYVRSHAQEVDEVTCAAHINLYVNRFSLEPGQEGEQAMAYLLAAGERLGLFPATQHSIYTARHSTEISD